MPVRASEGIGDPPVPRLPVPQPAPHWRDVGAPGGRESRPSGLPVGPPFDADDRGSLRPTDRKHGRGDRLPAGTFPVQWGPNGDQEGPAPLVRRKKGPKRAADLHFLWSGRRDSNPRPPPWQGGALPAEPRPRGTHSTKPPPTARTWPGVEGVPVTCPSSRSLPRLVRTREVRRPRTALRVGPAP
jgi:hypothetical protein